MASKFLQYFIVLFLLLTILQFAWISSEIDKLYVEEEKEFIPILTPTAQMMADVTICINDKPELNIPCNTTIDQAATFSCQLSVNDSDNNTSHTYSSSFITNITVFTIGSSGLISFTPNNTDVGNHSVNLTVQDNSTCINSIDWGIFNFSVQNINDAPVLVINISDIDFDSGEVVSAFFLTNHFADPDGDNMTFNVSGADEANITITALGEVIVNSDVCDFSDVVFFTARDPSNLTGTSNAVTISCTTPVTSSGSTATGGGGGGGGGGICRSNFECYDHRKCTVNNTEIRRCVDKNGCVDVEYITVECNYVIEQLIICEEDWLCGDWETCLMNNTQTRDCIDVSKCDTNILKPEAEQECEYIPTCFDGVKNGNETGTDCGGSCEICKVIETPTSLPETVAFFSTLLLWLIIAFLITMYTFKKYHKEAYLVLAKLGLHFAGRVPKQILLGDKDRDKLLKEIRKIESSYKKENLQQLTQDYIDLAKSYFSIALGLEIDSNKEDLLAKCEETKVNEHLLRVLASFFDKHQAIEFSPESLEGYELMYLVAELREVVMETSVYESELLETEITEYSIDPKLYYFEKIHLMMVNAYIALNYNQMDAAVKKYMDLIEYYGDLPDAEEDTVYEDIARLYQKIKYRAAWIENM